MANLIQIEIRAQDNATAALQGVNRSLGDIGSSLIGVGSALTLATAPLTAFLGTALKQASDQQTAMAQLESVIRSTGGAAGVTSEAALDLADSLSKVTRFSDDAILSAENLLLTFTSIGSDIFPDVTKIALDMSTALGQDLKSSVMQLGKALNDPITGLTALRRVGVQFTDAQQEMIEGMVTAGDLMGAQRAILAELTKEFGGSAEAAGNTFAGKLDILNNKFGELQEKIGFIIMPVLERFIDLIDRGIDAVAAWTNKNPGLTRVLTLFAGVLVTLGPALIIVGTGMKLVSTAASGVGLAISALSSPFLLAGAAIAATVVGLGVLASALGVDVLGGLRELGNQVTRFLDIVGDHGLLGAIRLLFVTFEDGSSSLSAIFEGFGMAREQAESLATGINETVQSVVQSFERFVAGFQVNIGLIPFYFKYHLQQVEQFVDDYILDPLRGVWRIAEPYVQEILTWFATDFLSGVLQVGEWIDTYIVTPLTNLWTQLQPVLSQVASFVVSVFQPVIDFIERVVAAAEAAYSVLQRIGSGTMVKPPEVKGTGVYAPGSLSALDGNPYARQYGGGGGGLFSRDFGGRGYAGMPVTIGTGAQPEVYIPDSPGTFYPRGEGMPGGAGGIQFRDIIIQEAHNPAATKQAVIDAIVQIAKGE